MVEKRKFTPSQYPLFRHHHVRSFKLVVYSDRNKETCRRWWKKPNFIMKCTFYSSHIFTQFCSAFSRYNDYLFTYSNRVEGKWNQNDYVNYKKHGNFLFLLKFIWCTTCMKALWTFDMKKELKVKNKIDIMHDSPAL